jgi:hypothetical protein
VIPQLRPCLGALNSAYKRKKQNKPAKRAAFYFALVDRHRQKISPTTAFLEADRTPRYEKKPVFPPAPRLTDSSYASPPRPALDLASRGAPPARSSSPSSPPASNRAAASSPACGSVCSPPTRRQAFPPRSNRSLRAHGLPAATEPGGGLLSSLPGDLLPSLDPSCC